jgi:hypothetical protein
VNIFISNGHMESLIKNSSSVGVKFEAEFLMSISYIDLYEALKLLNIPPDLVLKFILSHCY